MARQPYHVPNSKMTSSPEGAPLPQATTQHVLSPTYGGSRPVLACANLTLTGGIIQNCLKGIDLPISTTSSIDEWHLLNAKYLSANSSQPLETSNTMSFPKFCAQFTEQNIRWETLGIFLSAVTRAAMDMPFFQSLYTREEWRHMLQRLCTRVADSALEIALSLDCLNDLQLFLQYENWIVHTNVYGDHSSFCLCCLYKNLARG